MEEVNYGVFTTEDFDKGYWGQMRRVALSRNGEVVGVHHPDNTNLWEDGTEVDWTEYENNGWNCMVQMPVFYYRTQRKEYLGEDTYRAEISTEPKPGFKHHPAFEREDGVIENYQYMSAFEGWVDGEGYLRSLPNKTVTSNKTISEFRNHALQNGPWYSQQDFYLTSAVQMLMIIELGGFNAQEKLANGNIGSTYQPTGLSLSLGNKSGGDNTFMSYRGIENFYMNYYKWMDGININNYRSYIAKQDFQDDKFNDNYQDIGLSMPTNSGEYITDFYYSDDHDFGFIPSETEDRSDPTTAIPDRYYINSGQRVVRFGGPRSNGAAGGPFCFSGSYDPSSAYLNSGARLQFLKS